MYIMKCKNNEKYTLCTWYMDNSPDKQVGYKICETIPCPEDEATKKKGVSQG